MKTILVATDFSDAAHNAALYAAELAKAFNARLILFNAYQQVPVPVSEAPAIPSLEELHLQAQQKLEEEAQIISAAGVLNVGISSKAGFVSDAILKTAEGVHADVIVAGMKKSGKGMRRFFGSVVTALVRKLNMPLIVVPEDVKYSPITTIALANETDIAPETDKHILDTIRELGEKFNSRLYLIRVAKNKLAEAWQMLNSPFRITRLLRTLDPVYKCIEGRDISKALNEFNAAYHVNMLALLPQRHSLVDRWFIKSNTRAMIFETPFPLLILPQIHKKESEFEVSDRTDPQNIPLA